jgi:uncharacterized protein
MVAPEQLHFDEGKLAALCQERRIVKLSLFGSAVRKELRPDSDMDVLIEFEPGMPVSYFTLGGIQQDLTDLFGRHVDLKIPTTLSKYVKERVLNSAVPIYVRR